MAEEVEKVRLKDTAGRHYLGDNENGNPEYLEPGEEIERSEVDEPFLDKFEPVRVIEGRTFSEAEAEQAYDRAYLEEQKKAVLMHIAHEEKNIPEDAIGTEHSQTDEPTKDDYVDAILANQ